MRWLAISLLMAACALPAQAEDEKGPAAIEAAQRRAQAAFARGDMAAAQKAFAAEIRLRDKDDHEGLVNAHINLAMVQRRGGQFRAAVASTKRADEIARASQRTGLEMTAARALGRSYLELGDPMSAQAPLERSIRLAREAG